MPPDEASGPSGEVYVEFFRQGNSVKVTAIDAVSGLEATIVGPRSASDGDLQALAINKLRARMSGKPAATSNKKAPANPRRGIIV